LDHRRQPNELGVVGDDEEVEWPDELHRLAGVGDHRFAACEAITRIDIEAGPHQAGVKRQVGVEMGIAEEDLVGKGAAGE